MNNSQQTLNFEFEETNKEHSPVTVLGRTFVNDEERRRVFREELRAKLPELRQIEGFPIGEDDDIINLSDPPYYTACPNPWLNDFIAQWEQEKEQLKTEGKRVEKFEVKEPYAADVSEGRSNPVYIAHTYHTKVPHPAIMRYILHYTQPGDIVLDGFCGTGMTGIAAYLCGKKSIVTSLGIDYCKSGERHAICCDLSPLASSIASYYNTHNETALVVKEAKRILNELREELGWMYETIDENGIKGQLNLIVWTEFYVCPNCGVAVSFWDNAVSHKEKCILDTFPCPECKAEINKKCDKVFSTQYDDAIQSTINSVKVEPAYIVYTTPDKKRHERKVNKFDMELIEKIDQYKIENQFPIDRLPIGYNTEQPKKGQGYEYCHQFYTKRNLIALSSLFNKIEKSSCSSKLKFLFTGLLNRASVMNRFSARNYFFGGGGWNKGALNGTLYIPAIPVETPLFVMLQSRIDSCESVVSFLPAGGQDNIIMTASACKLPMPDATIDYIFIDPPFGANIMYSELNYISEAWLRVFTNNRTEAIINKEQKKSLFEYQGLMAEALSEFYRVLKGGKWLTMEFSNTSASVWNSIQNSIQGVGFVIANVAALDKKQGSFKAVTTTTAVKQDLIITCFKPTNELSDKFARSSDTLENVWDFVTELLEHLPVHIEREHKTTTVVERSPKILYDRLIAYYVQHGYPIPLDAQEFQQGLKERFVMRDGMFFNAEQAVEYDLKKHDAPDLEGFSLFVDSEQSGIHWLKNELKDKPQTYQDVQPKWMQAMANPRKGDRVPELMDILKENFLEDESGYWRLPDPEKEADLEKIRTKKLLREFDHYVEHANLAKSKKLKDARLEALRVGFKDCYQKKEFATIIKVGDKIPESLLTEDEILLQYYDIATTRV